MKSHAKGSLSNLNLGGTDNLSKLKIKFTHHKRINDIKRPHHSYENWVSGYQIPWVCFIEIAIMILYLFFGYLHQRTTIDFTNDFSKLVDVYFLSGFDFPTDEDGNIEEQVQIVFRDKFLAVLNETGYRLFTFKNEIPFANSFTSDYIVTTEIKFQNSIIKYFFSHSNISRLLDVIEEQINQFDLITLSATYQMIKNEETQEIDKRLKLTIFSRFSFDRNTKFVTLDLYNTRIPHTEIIEWNSIITSPLITFPLVIVILSIIAIILTFYYIRNIHNYCRKKATKNFVPFNDVFWDKFDKWAIFSLICHALSIISCLIYTINQSDYQDSVPITMILMAISTFCHCVLLLRYLQEKQSTMIIVNVTIKAIMKIGQFLIGCITIFIAYLVLGCSFFGSYDDTFKTFIDGAECLLAVVHGDSIQAMFDAANVRPNISEWYGIIYWGLWIFFSLTIMFNISISIFEEVLTKEINMKEKEKLKKAKENKYHNDQFTFVLPLQYKRVL
ncbi:hypothetical protein TRFO_30077 [Tritrichomonas foetus]|uniref:Polycystin cation channel PKD1/PKD2 domain-containing protein n=1 Tax=Tritrichomonas foetus TaxID=1144522 RepID=A0A1J4JYZ1_9EUKA|nr:hypothetical protein TRFO_30077 [Tritrichomonas foetus]|eukprot:OHT02718.1 hypothetical protein TRFO_30077 [Tritrichomonas foetus]